jgi:hypothetical protein
VRRTYRGAAALALALALTSTGCSQGALTAAQRSRATTLPTPTRPRIAPGKLLGERVRGLLDLSAAVSVDEDLQVDATEQLNRVSWGARGTVVDASLQTLAGEPSGTEVFRTPGSLLARAIGPRNACWWQAGPDLARFNRPTSAEIAVLRSARAISGTSSLLRGSVSALSVMRVIGTAAELRRRHLLPRSGVRVAATFGTTTAGVLITLTWAGLVTAAGNSSRHSRAGTWTFRYQTLGSFGPKPPPPGQVLQVSQTDPGFRSVVDACNARFG